MTFHLLLLILAAVCFLLAALNIQVKQLNLVALGLLLWIMATSILRS